MEKRAFKTYLNNDIIKIELIKNVRIKNTHNNFIFPKQNIMKVCFRNNEIKTLDLFSEKDITNIDYFKILEDKKTKTKILFEEKEIKELFKNGELVKEK